jgi:hypothetical protein
MRLLEILICQPGAQASSAAVYWYVYIYIYIYSREFS